MLGRRVVSVGLAALLTMCLAGVAAPADAASPAGEARPLTTPGRIPQAVLKAADALTGGRTGAAAATFGRKPAAHGAVATAAENVITCYGQAQYPHASTGGNGIPGSLDGKAKSWCDNSVPPVPHVGVQVELYQYVPNLGLFVIAIGNLNYGVGPGPYTGTAFGPCTGAPNYYVTKGIHTFTAPEGYSPPSVEFATYTPVVQVTC